VGQYKGCVAGEEGEYQRRNRSWSERRGKVSTILHMKVEGRREDVKSERRLVGREGLWGEREKRDGTRGITSSLEVLRRLGKQNRTGKGEGQHGGGSQMRE